MLTGRVEARSVVAAAAFTGSVRDHQVLMSQERKSARRHHTLDFIPAHSSQPCTQHSGAPQLSAARLCFLCVSGERLSIGDFQLRAGRGGNGVITARSDAFRQEAAAARPPLPALPWFLVCFFAVVSHAMLHG